MNKHQRQVAIKQIITQRLAGTQAELCKALKKAGFDVTQATLSRDLKEIGIARVNMPEGVRYVLHPETEEQKMRSFVGYEVEQIVANEAVIVVKTLPGRAQGVAEIIDSIHHSAILGTLAGDNTIFITPTSVKKIPDVLRALRALMKEEKQAA